MSRRHRRHNQSKKKSKPSKNRRRQSRQAGFETSNHQTTPERTNDVDDHTAEIQRFDHRLNGFLMRHPKIEMGLYLLLGTVGGCLIGVTSSVLVITLHTDLGEPWPYLINGVALLALDTVRSWLYYWLYPPLSRYVKSLASRRFEGQTGIEVSGVEAPEVKWDFGKDAKIVIVATVGMATYLTTNPAYTVELLQIWIFDNIHSMIAAMGAMVMLLRGLSDQQVIQIIVKGKIKGQIAHETLHPKGE